MQEAKQWLEQQNTELLKESTELRKWIEELENGNAYMQQQWQEEKKTHAKTRVEFNLINEQLQNYENTIASQKYVLNLLLDDKWIQKVIKLRKLPVYE